jgi:hypothetical protein
VIVVVDADSHLGRTPCGSWRSWFFNITCMYGIWVWAVWFVVKLPEDWWQILFTLYCCYLVFELLHVVANLFYTNSPRTDLAICLVFFLMPFYQVLQLAVRLIATT